MLPRILVVEDYEPFRRFVCSVLEADTEFQVVGQAKDGLTAIRKAEKLQPDLILLDIGLPKLNGLQAATRIRNVAPGAKILFVSQDFSSDFVEAALDLGARGYLHKLRVHTELLPAIRAVLEDKYFVSGILDRQLSKAAQRSSVRHEVQFYSQDAALLESFTDFVADTLTDNKAAIVIASESHRAGVLQGLNRQKMDVDGAIKSGVLIPLDVAETSATFIRDHGDPARFFETAAGLIEAATKAVKGKKTPNVAICREPPPSWLAEGEVERTLKLERLWSEFAHSCVMDLLCGYSLASLANHDDVFQGICAEHSVIFSH